MDKATSKISYDNATNNKIRNRGSELEVSFTCKDCGKTVTMPLGQILWYHDEGLIVPSRCKECSAEKNKRFEK